MTNVQGDVDGEEAKEGAFGEGSMGRYIRLAEVRFFSGQNANLGP